MPRITQIHTNTNSIHAGIFLSDIMTQMEFVVFSDSRAYIPQTTFTVVPAAQLLYSHFASATDSRTHPCEAGCPSL